MNINFFNNNFDLTDEILINDKSDGYTENFGKQWRDYQDVQIDSLNNFKISEMYLNDLLFNDLDFLKNKKILEIGCGAGRFTEHIIKYAKKCVSVDFSSAIFFNVAKNNNNLILIKSDFLKLIPNEKFDIVICRGVLQHTPNPELSINKLFEFIDNNGSVFFDYYQKPKIGIFHPKYFYWRPLFNNFIKYEKFEKFLNKNINFLLRIKKLIKIILFNSELLSDFFVPLWNIRDKKIKLNKTQYNNWTILDTLDGLYAKYDNPKSNKEIIKILKSNNLVIKKNNEKRNFFYVVKK